MEELKTAAAHCGLAPETTELATGGFLKVLKKSKKLEDGAYGKVIGFLGEQGEQALKTYEKISFRDALPKPKAAMLLPRPDFAPPGPPPWVVVKALAKGIKKVTRKDKDAGNTEETLQLLQKKSANDGVEEENLLKFMQVFIVLMQEKVEIDISEILCLPVSDGK